MSLLRVGVSAGVVLSLGLAVTGCGSGAKPETTPGAVALQGSDPVAWAGAFCTGLGDVLGGLATAAQSGSSPQSQKDGVLAFSDVMQKAFTSTAQKLEQLGPPKITDGQKAQDAAVGYFHTAAGTVSEQRAKLAALDVNDPDFTKKAATLTGPDLSAASAQMQGLTTNKDLAPAFSNAPECKHLGDVANGK
ncbi:MAG TPA: hypothetical protein VFO16_18815 [Pseudonocardiaceae bacterium]|nr:hypothetical protein [Pseudonocardiaceae bacterium]